MKIDIDAKLKTVKNVAVGVITSATSTESEKVIAEEFEGQLSTVDSGEETFLIGCGICYSSYQSIHIKVTSQKTIKGDPNRFYDLNFIDCIDKSDYSLFSKVVIFDNGKDVRDIMWKLLNEENLKTIDAYAKNDS